MRNLALLILVTTPIVTVIPRHSVAQNAAPMLINYQGELRSPATGEPVPDGAYDMLFRIYDDATEGAPLWEQIHSTLYDNPIQVRNGVFNVLVGSGTGSPLDRSIFSGLDRWLEVRVGTETLSPRQRIVSSAYSIVCEDSRLFSGREASSFADAIHAHSGAEITSGTVSETWIDPLITRDSETDSAIAAHAAIADAHHTKTSSFAELSDVAADAQIPPSIARDSEVVPTVLAGDGAGSNLDADYLDGNDSSAFALAEHVHDSRYWDLTGNTGTDPATHFLGTADNQALEFRVNNVQVLRLEPGDSPNIIAGYGGNAVTAGAVGAAIAGGGAAGFDNRVTDDYGTIGGGRNNQAGDNTGTTADARYGTVGGGYSNTARADYGTVGGGFVNAAIGEYATVAGGDSNEAGGSASTVSGGFSNSASGLAATVAGGAHNDGSGDHAAVGGGYWNTARAQYGTVGGGFSNDATANHATVAGGDSNEASGEGATVAGGYENAASYTRATVGGGSGNTASGHTATVGGGLENTASGSDATVGGGAYNEASASYATIAGGGPSDPAIPSTTRNLATDDYSTVGGGGNNQAGDNAGTTTDASYATVGGGYSNIASGEGATVGGGYSNDATAKLASVAGGDSNEASGDGATVGGGYSNSASDSAATVAGGYNNDASGSRGTVGGGLNNTASGAFATVPGGNSNSAVGDYSFAAGRMAKANYDGCFVWGDSTNNDIGTLGPNRFVVRASGGVSFYSASDLSTGVRLVANDSAWSIVSDRARKENIRQVDRQEILKKLIQVPICRWNYKGATPDVEHIGPMAQDFYAAFGLGDDEKYINTIDPDGVALAAIQGLHEIVQEKDGEISSLKEQNAKLDARVASLEALVATMVKEWKGAEQ